MASSKNSEQLAALEKRWANWKSYRHAKYQALDADFEADRIPAEDFERGIRELDAEYETLEVALSKARDDAERDKRLDNLEKRVDKLERQDKEQGG